MSAAALALVVTAAAFHAVWNTLAKRGGDPFLFLWGAVISSAVLVSPVAVFLVLRGEIALGALPYILGSGTVHAVYFYALGRSYVRGDLSTVYPIARGLSIALVPVAAWYVYDEHLTGLGVAGIAAVVIGIVAVGRAGATGWALGPGAGWALLTGCCTASYSLIDRGGVTLAHPAAYIVLFKLGATVLLLPAVLRRRAQLRAVVRREWGRILVGGLIMLAGYTLVLFAFRLSKTGYVVAARELSIVASTLIGVWLLREGAVLRRVSGAAVIFAGVVCIALAE